MTPLRLTVLGSGSVGRRGPGPEGGASARA